MMCIYRRLILFPLMIFAVAVTTWSCGPKYPNCKEDADCKEAEYCIMGLCQQCRDNADCGPGKQCNGGRCEAMQGYCQSAADCGPGERCENSRCVTASSRATPKPSDDDLTKAEDSGPCASQQGVFFEFDSDTLSEAARAEPQKTAACLKNRSLGIHLTGHCDPRGTEEYNLALGDRRANSVKTYLKNLGVAEPKLSTSSMGEELADPGKPDSWEKDRRVDFAGN